jgi:hypothetical protein
VTVDNIIFGDNQFFGINHISETVASSQLERFSKLENIIRVLDIAYSNGIKGFMLNSNDRVSEICDYLRRNFDYWGGLHIYPSIPYPHKYVRKIVEEGTYKALTNILAEGRKSILALFKGGVATVRKDIIQMMKALVDIELQKYEGLNIQVVFLQNIVTDLMLGLGLEEILYEFSVYIEEKYNVKAGFITLNLPMLVYSLKRTGINRPIIMAPYNKKGFFMNPSRQACEKVVAEEEFEFIAMSVLASGAIPPREALEYVFESKKIYSVIFGASSKTHILETKNIIEEYLRNKDLNSHKE